MPIYEFYCPECHTIFNFFARRVNPDARPDCPTCGRGRLEREVSAFAVTTGAGSEGSGGEGDDELPLDPGRLERAMGELAGEAERIPEDNPREAANLMRRFSRMTGLRFGDGVEEALGRMEAGEDPEAIEAEMGDRLENEEPFLMAERHGKGADAKRSRGAPRRDPKLYDL